MKQPATQFRDENTTSTRDCTIPALPEEQNAKRKQTAKDYCVQLAAMSHAKKVMGESLNNKVCTNSSWLVHTLKIVCAKTEKCMRKQPFKFVNDSKSSRYNTRILV